MPSRTFSLAMESVERSNKTHLSANVRIEEDVNVAVDAARSDVSERDHYTGFNTVKVSVMKRIRFVSYSSPNTRGSKLNMKSYTVNTAATMKNCTKRHCRQTCAIIS